MRPEELFTEMTGRAPTVAQVHSAMARTVRAWSPLWDPIRKRMRTPDSELWWSVVEDCILAAATGPEILRGRERAWILRPSPVCQESLERLGIDLERVQEMCRKFWAWADARR